METNPPDRAELEQLLAENVQRLEALEKAFAGAEHRAQKYARENELLQGHHKDIQEELRQLQHDYESLRVQKGGFGFKALSAAAFAGAIAGFLFCYLFFKPIDDHAEALERFQHEYQFNIEYAIGQGQFVQAENTIKESMEKPENALIRRDIEVMYKIVSAAKRRCN